MTPRKAKAPEPSVTARTLTREWADDWPYPDDATVVLVEIDGHLVAEAVVTEEPRHRLDGGGTRPKVLMRGVIVRAPRGDDPEGLGFGVDVFPCHVAHTGARIVETVAES